MCGGGRMKYDQLPDGQALVHIARGFNAEVVGQNTITALAPRNLIKPGDPVAALAWSKTYNCRILLPLTWGMQIAGDRLTFNARDDRLFDAPSWREPMLQGHRCLVLFSSFIEKNTDFRHSTSQFLTLAGIYKAGRVVIVTTNPNTDVRAVHHRMPAIIDDPLGIRMWIKPELEADLAHNLLEPYPGRLIKSAA